MVESTLFFLTQVLIVLSVLATVLYDMVRLRIAFFFTIQNTRLAFYMEKSGNNNNKKKLQEFPFFYYKNKIKFLW